MPKPIGLGRGLEALIPGANEANAAGKGAVEIAVGEIRANPHQPRLTRGLEALNLEELAASIREHGILQPIIVTRTTGPGAPYTLIAGERRWRASQLAGLTHVPVIIKDVAPQQMLELALIENIQRSDLGALEEAAAYQQLMNEFGLTQESVAERVGKSRTTVTNTVRLLKLPGQAQAALMNGQISEGHARALLGLPGAIDQLVALETVTRDGLNVRQTEELVRKLGERGQARRPARAKGWPDGKRYEAGLRDALGAKVTLRRGRKGGRIIIDFYSEEEFSALYERITQS
ncbi:MAG: ParB/RepB/Spo0J family partition protein [Thermoflexales bacterium]|nr:ParB/RepB/Spo0J family partition protein [Thermoflexales bacterium]